MSKWSEKAYSGKQWMTIRKWIETNKKQIARYGFNQAAGIVNYTTGNFPDQHLKDGWTPLPGLAPTEGQMQEVCRNFNIDVGDQDTGGSKDGS